MKTGEHLQLMIPHAEEQAVGEAPKSDPDYG